MLWLCLAGALLPVPNGVGVADDQALIEGEWQVESIQDGGKTVDLLFVSTKLTVTNGIMTIRGGGIGWTKDLRITLNQNTSPKQFDIVYVGDDPKLRVQYQGGVHGIYKFDGGRFVRCYAKDDLPRPTSFVSPPGSNVRLQVLKRPEAPSLPK